MNELTAARLRELLTYNPDTGVFVRMVRTSSRAPAGGVAGIYNDQGYLVIRVDVIRYRAHRLAWLYVHGVWPTGQIDHIDGNRANNRLSNLRDVSHSVNQQNRHGAHSNNKSGLLGVHADRGYWMAQIKINGKSRNLGRFDTPEQAHAAYIAAKRSKHLGCTI